MNIRPTIAKALRAMEATYWWCVDEYQGGENYAAGGAPDMTWHRTAFWETQEIWSAFFLAYNLPYFPVRVTAQTIAALDAAVDWFSHWVLTWPANNRGKVWLDYMVQESDDATIARFSDGVWYGFNLGAGDWAGLEEYSSSAMLQPYSRQDYDPWSSDVIRFWFPAGQNALNSGDAMPGYPREQFLLHDLAAKAWLVLMEHKAHTTIGPLVKGSVVAKPSPSPAANRARTVVAVGIGTAAALALVWWWLA